MKKILLSAAAVLFLLCGCTVIRQMPEAPAEIRQNEKEYALGRELLEAFLKNDGKKFVSLLAPAQQKDFGLKKFADARKKVLDSFGEPVSYRFVTCLEMTAVTPQIWAVRFRRESRKDGRIYHSEILFRVITGTVNGRPIIISFNFQ